MLGYYDVNVCLCCFECWKDFGFDIIKIDFFNYKEKYEGLYFL